MWNFDSAKVFMDEHPFFIIIAAAIAVGYGYNTSFNVHKHTRKRMDFFLRVVILIAGVGCNLYSLFLFLEFISKIFVYYLPINYSGIVILFLLYSLIWLADMLISSGGEVLDFFGGRKTDKNTYKRNWRLFHPKYIFVAECVVFIAILIKYLPKMF